VQVQEYSAWAIDMLGYKDRHFKTHPLLTLEELVPDNHFMHKLEAQFDLEFVRDLVCDFYPNFGRPSIDPVVYFKLQLIMFFDGIRSERQLMEQVHVNLAYRWYIGYDLDNMTPADMYFGRYTAVTTQRERIKQQTLQQRRDHYLQATVSVEYDDAAIETNRFR
jgi:transposase